jgi:hypothetical protein
MTATDEAQVEFAQQQRKVIFTQDADFLRLHQTGVAHSGINLLYSGEPFSRRDYPEAGSDLGTVRTGRDDGESRVFVGAIAASNEISLVMPQG